LKKTEKIQLIGLLAALVLIIAGIHIYKFIALRNTEETFAVYTESNIGVGVTQKYFSFKTLKGKEFKSSVVFTEKLNIGDTVWIEYSTFDEDVIEVIDIDYKKHLKK
jgi:hypothetical protein